jgi:beta-N-acetylhexosaminidase
MSHGPLMLDLEGLELTVSERELLLHPAVGGVILFARNYASTEQVTRLIDQIHVLRRPALLVAVDQEGGRVQRLREGFTRLPPAAWLGKLYERHPAEAKRVARELAWLMATELRAVGVDFSFAPVLDIGRDVSHVIGDRALHSRPHVVAELGRAWHGGAQEAGMASVGKHFPGHGGVVEDSHEALPVDRRRVEDLMMEDLVPFERMIHLGLEAIMPAHVIYEKADPRPAGFSAFWLRRVLRERLGFQGVVFSDDLAMAAAGEAGDYAARARAALEAGCDMILVCNDRTGAETVLDELSGYSDPVGQTRLVRMHGRGHVERDRLHLDPRWQAAVRLIGESDESPAFSLDL